MIIFVVLIGKLAYALDIGSYRRLDDSARLTLINRSLFCLVYLVSFAPYTVSAYFIFFSPTSSAGLGSSDLQTQLKAWALRLLSVLLGVQLSMHVFEVRPASYPHSAVLTHATHIEGMQACIMLAVDCISFWQ